MQLSAAWRAPRCRTTAACRLVQGLAVPPHVRPSHIGMRNTSRQGPVASACTYAHFRCRPALCNNKIHARWLTQGGQGGQRNATNQHDWPWDTATEPLPRSASHPTTSTEGRPYTASTLTDSHPTHTTDTQGTTAAVAQVVRNEAGYVKEASDSLWLRVVVVWTGWWLVQEGAG